MDQTQTETIRRIVTKHRSLPGALLPMLHAIQAEIGWVPVDAVPSIAAALSLSQAEVHGTISFYHHFRRTPSGRHVVQVCRAESCQACGANILETHAKASLGVDYHATTADGAVTLEPVYCLGNCACSPAIRVDDEIVGRVDADRFDEIVASLRSGKGAA